MGQYDFVETSIEFKDWLIWSAFMPNRLQSDSAVSNFQTNRLGARAPSVEVKTDCSRANPELLEHEEVCSRSSSLEP